MAGEKLALSQLVILGCCLPVAAKVPWQLLSALWLQAALVMRTIRAMPELWQKWRQVPQSRGGGFSWRLMPSGWARMRL